MKKLIALVVIFSLTLAVLAAEGDVPPPAPPPAPAADKAAETKKPDPPANTQPVGAKPSVLDQLQTQLQANPMIEPAAENKTGKPRPAIRVGIDPKVLGIAPGMEAPKLRREGDFVINRRGRLMPSSDGLHALFAFESDGSAMADAPMVLVPCQTLESMEGLIQERGDRIVFLLSGQILEYRGVNYLMPTMMKLDIDRGNIQK